MVERFALKVPNELGSWLRPVNQNKAAVGFFSQVGGTPQEPKKMMSKVVVNKVKSMCIFWNHINEIEMERFEIEVTWRVESTKQNKMM